MAFNESELATIKGIIKKLNGERCSDAVAAAISNEDAPARLYLQSWVIPALELLIKEGRTKEDLRLARDLAN
jgi:hypothetical protein